MHVSSYWHHHGCCWTTVFLIKAFLCIFLSIPCIWVCKLCCHLFMLLNLIGRSCLTASETSDPLRSIMAALTARALFSSCIWRYHGLKLGSSPWEVVWLYNYGPTIIDSSSDYQLCGQHVFLDWTGLVKADKRLVYTEVWVKKNQDTVLKKEIWEIVDYLNTYI